MVAGDIEGEVEGAEADVSQVPVFPVRVTPEAQLKVPSGARPQFQAWLQKLAGTDCELVVRKRKSKRSLDQNAWIWGVAYPLIAEAIGYGSHEIEDMHYGLVAKWAGEHFDKRLGSMVPNKRSSQLSTVEFSKYMEWLVIYAAESLNCCVPLPGESEAA